MYHNLFPTYNNHDNHNLEQSAELDYRLKINPKDNTITIKPIKDSWNREEVVSLIKDYRNQLVPVNSLLIEETNKWIEQNL